MAFGSIIRSLAGGSAPGGKVLVAYASQTGAAEQIARASANALIAKIVAENSGSAR